MKSMSSQGHNGLLVKDSEGYLTCLNIMLSNMQSYFQMYPIIVVPYTVYMYVHLIEQGFGIYIINC